MAREDMSSNIEARLIGPFMAMRLFVRWPDTAKHVTLISLRGRIWVKMPRWMLRWWPAEMEVSDGP